MQAKKNAPNWASPHQYNVSAMPGNINRNYFLKVLLSTVFTLLWVSSADPKRDPFRTTFSFRIMKMWHGAKIRREWWMFQYWYMFFFANFCYTEVTVWEGALIMLQNPLVWPRIWYFYYENLKVECMVDCFGGTNHISNSFDIKRHISLSVTFIFGIHISF
jgi:hypothetical protein